LGAEQRPACRGDRKARTAACGAASRQIKLRVPLTGGVGARPEEAYEASPGYTPSQATLARGRWLSCSVSFLGGSCGVLAARTVVSVRKSNGFRLSECSPTIVGNVSARRFPTLCCSHVSPLAGVRIDRSRGFGFALNRSQWDAARPLAVRGSEQHPRGRPFGFLCDRVNSWKGSASYGAEASRPCLDPCDRFLSMKH